MEASVPSVKAKPKRTKTESLIHIFVCPKPGSDPWITGTVITLMVFGSVMVISTNLGSTIGQVRSLYFAIIKQTVFCLLAWEFGIVAVSRLFHYKRAAAFQPVLAGIYLLLLIYTAAFGSDINGSKAWISLGGMFTLQPSEFGKPLLIMTLALSTGQLHRLPEERRTFWRVYAWPVVLMIISIVFVGGLQKDFGSLIITLGIGLVGMLVPSWKTFDKWQRLIGIAFAAVIVLMVVGAYFSDVFVTLFRDLPLVRHIAVRIENMRNPYLSIHNEGYQPANALYAIADGGLLGRGLGSSVRKYGFLTQAESDYILAIVIEETGVIGLGIILLGYSILLWRLMYWALRASHTSDKVLFTCCAAYLILHFFINIGGVSTLIPMTGVPLLFISAGGSALIAICITMGMAQARIAAVRKQLAQQARLQVLPGRQDPVSS